MSDHGKELALDRSVRAVLESFDALSEAEQHEVLIEVLRRVARPGISQVSDDALLSLADGLFQELDQREATDAQSSSR